MNEDEQPQEKKDESENHTEQESGFARQLKDKLSHLSESENIEQVFHFARSNTRDTIAYVALFVGLLMTLFGNFWGGMVVGVVAGVYFAEPIVGWLMNFQAYLEEEGMVKVLILLGVALAGLINAPSIFIGFVGTVAVKYMTAGK